MKRGALAAALAATLLAAGAASAAAAPARPCAHAPHFVCSSVVVPLDRTGTVPGTLRLHFAAQDRLRGGKVLIALTGGPGQSGIGFGPGFAAELKPALRDHRLVVVDQRGTGGSNPLNCPEVQGLDSLTEILTEDVTACARRIGPQRDSYATIDSADDLEAIRQALKVPKIAIYGVSYGTWLAQQYARRYPDHVERLVLDSVVPPGADPWDLRITESMPRVLRGLCALRACANITSDPFADLTAVVEKMRASPGGELRANVRDADGGRRATALSEFQLLSLLVSSDLNPWLQARIPSALVAARNGDMAPLLRLKRDAAGPPSSLGELSAGLFVDTTCLDQPEPYSYADPFDQRAAEAAAALAALPDASFAPFDRDAIDRSSASQICLHWPDGTFRPESTAPMPDVPTLILSGLADMRTPTEGAKALADTIPHVQFVMVPGSGHSVLTADATGCVQLALARFFADRTVGDPCKDVSDEIELAPVPPLHLADAPGTPGVPGERGRVLRAAVATVGDAWTSDNESLFAGFADSALGGLRGGHFEIIPTGRGDLLIMRHMVYVPGVSVDGAVLAAPGRFTGAVHVRAPGGLSGTLRLAPKRITGTLGGRRVHVGAGELVRARVSSVADRSPATDRAVVPFG